MVEAIDVSQIEAVALSEIYDISKFDCGDADINDFLKNDALVHQAERIANTILFVYKNQILGFCSLAADAICLDLDEKIESIPNQGSMKRYPQYPAVKLARFGRDVKYRDMNIGRDVILRWTIAHVKSLKVAVRFLTLDAYPKRVAYYEDLGFVRNLHKKYHRTEEDPVSMRLDLKIKGE
jgi:hypothetical protein